MRILSRQGIPVIDKTGFETYPLALRTAYTMAKPDEKHSEQYDHMLIVRDSATEHGGKHTIGWLRIGSFVVPKLVIMGIEPYAGKETTETLAEILVETPPRFDELSNIWVQIEPIPKLVHKSRFHLPGRHADQFVHAAYLEPFSALEPLL